MRWINILWGYWKEGNETTISLRLAHFYLGYNKSNREMRLMEDSGF